MLVLISLVIVRALQPRVVPQLDLQEDAGARQEVWAWLYFELPGECEQPQNNTCSECKLFFKSLFH